MAPLWAPWRISYIRAPKANGCIFCTKPKDKNDEKNFILYRGKHNFVILNLYPYNPGHVMVAPYRHIATVYKLPKVVASEMMLLVQLSEKILKNIIKPDGFNMGINIGKVAGAGVEDHVHFHVIPRWNGDTNCMPVLSGERVIPQALRETYEMLAKARWRLKF